MGEERIKVQATQVDYRCDQCSRGFMKLEDIDARPHYLHSCTNCGVRRNLVRAYPYFIPAKS